MPMKIEEIRKITDDEDRTAAAEELLAYALARVEEVRPIRDAGVRAMKAAGAGPAEITRLTKVSAPTVKALIRGVG